MIKTVFFDLGNVILPFDVLRLAKRLSRHSPFSPGQILNNIWNDHIASRFETGQMDTDEYFQHVCELIQLKNIHQDEFTTLFNDIFEVNEEVVLIVEKLKSKVKLGVISNTNPIHGPFVRENYDFFEFFELILFSNEFGARKPHGSIYKRALDHFGAEPQESVFIDDLEENLESAKAMGMNTIHFKDAQTLKNDLQRFGFLEKN